MNTITLVLKKIMTRKEKEQKKNKMKEDIDAQEIWVS